MSTRSHTDVGVSVKEIAGCVNVLITTAVSRV